ncbi:hypothetical protein EMIT0P100_50069 [Pseudomonas sp. IT-P100]
MEVHSAFIQHALSLTSQRAGPILVGIKIGLARYARGVLRLHLNEGHSFILSKKKPG